MSVKIELITATDNLHNALTKTEVSVVDVNQVTSGSRALELVVNVSFTVALIPVI